jgi:hypothetical protein
MTPIVPRRVVFSQNAWWALAIVVALVGTAAATGTAYDTIDDVLMNGFAAGRLIASAPNAHLIFTNVLVGLPLKLAYQAWDGLPWYGLYLLLTLSAATAAFLWAFAGALNSWQGRILVLAFLFGTVSVTFSRLQFTRVAFLAVEAGWIVVADGLARAGPRQRRAAGLGGALVLLGTCIRSEIGLLATLLCVPLLLATLGVALWRQSSRDRIRTALVPATVIVLCALAVAIDGVYYRMDHSWRTFLEYHDARTKLMGTTRGEATQIPADTLAHVAWSPNDVSLMYNYFGLHDKVFSLEHQQYVAEHSGGWRWSLGEDALKTLAPLRTSRFVPLFLMVALAALVLSDGLSAATVAGSMVLLAGIIGLLAADWKLPERFYEPALSIPAAAGLALLGRRAETERGRLLVRRSLGGGGRTWVATVLGLAALGVAVAQLADDFLIVQDNHEDHRNIVSAIAQLHPRPEQLYVAWGGDFSYNALVNPLDGFSDADNLQILPLGWANHAPLQRQRLAEHHVSDVYQALWQNPNVFLIASVDRCLRLAAFVANHYGQLVSCVPINESLSIYKVTPTFARGPSINIRWRNTLSDSDRQNLEARYGLRRPRPLEDATWRYELADTSSALLAALVRDPMVDDTAGLDRRTGALTQPQPDW